MNIYADLFGFFYYTTIRKDEIKRKERLEQKPMNLYLFYQEEEEKSRENRIKTGKTSE